MVVAYVKNGYAKTTAGRGLKSGDELQLGESIVPKGSVTIAVEGREDLTIYDGDSLVLDKSVVSAESLTDETSISFEQLDTLNLTIENSFDLSLNEGIDFSNIESTSTGLMPDNQNLDINDLVETKSSDLEVFLNEPTEQTHNNQTTTLDTSFQNTQGLPELLNEDDISLLYSQG